MPCTIFYSTGTLHSINLPTALTLLCHQYTSKCIETQQCATGLQCIGSEHPARATVSPRLATEHCYREDPGWYDLAGFDNVDAAHWLYSRALVHPLLSLVDPQRKSRVSNKDWHWVAELRWVLGAGDQYTEESSDDRLLQSSRSSEHQTLTLLHTCTQYHYQYVL